jgi:hypothetical protein
VLRSLGVDELRSILAEQGAVTVTCEFCGRPYQFDAIDVERLFAVGASPETRRSRSIDLPHSRGFQVLSENGVKFVSRS